jgi:hypothetical protein
MGGIGTTSKGKATAARNANHGPYSGETMIPKGPGCPRPASIPIRRKGKKGASNGKYTPNASGT